jgi:cob(I)alamin adenosyltransferase
MVRKKEVVDAKIAAAQTERGVIVITTGNGKGKSSSGFGMVVRAMGHGMRTGVVQFIKGAIPSGEEMFLRRFPDQCEFHVMGEGYTWETQDRARDVAKAEAAWEVARRMLRDPSIGLVLFDELNIALKLHYLDVDTVIADLRARRRCSTWSSPAVARRRADRGRRHGDRHDAGQARVPAGHQGPAGRGNVIASFEAPWQPQFPTTH